MEVFIQYLKHWTKQLCQDKTRKPTICNVVIQNDNYREGWKFIINHLIFVYPIASPLIYKSLSILQPWKVFLFCFNTHGTSNFFDSFIFIETDVKNDIYYLIFISFWFYRVITTWLLIANQFQSVKKFSLGSAIYISPF